jgi:hypothetical protein
MRGKFARPCAWLLTLIFLLAQAPLTRSEQNPSVPFKATISAVAVGTPCGTYTADGNAAHLGAITEFGTYCIVGVLGPGVFQLAGEGTQVAANGDSVTFTFEEVVDLNANPLVGTATFTITGGTGRFANATGGGTFASTGTAVDQTFNLSIEYTGTIAY